MTNFGFVYILHNLHMPNALKIGCTERSPHLRAIEISNATGVPDNFYVVCYGEYTDFQAVERDVHAFAKNYRINPNREFFRRGCLLPVMAMLNWHPNRLAYSEIDPSFIHQFSDGKFSSIDSLNNPFEDCAQWPLPLEGGRSLNWGKTNVVALPGAR